MHEQAKTSGCYAYAARDGYYITMIDIKQQETLIGKGLLKYCMVLIYKEFANLKLITPTIINDTLQKIEGYNSLKYLHDKV